METRIRRPKRTFTSEFKTDAIELGHRIGITKASEKLGIHHSSLRDWTKKASLSKGIDSSNNINGNSYSELAKENRRLEKEIRYLREINSVLKKSTAILSADLMGNSK